MASIVDIKLAVYRHFAETGGQPSIEHVANRTGVSVDDALAGYRDLAGQRMFVLEADGVSIRMAPPFSGVETQHVVESDGVRYHGNCAWDALGIPAALHRPGTVLSRSEQTMQPLRLEIGVDGPEPSEWLFHCHLPAAKWWDDIVFT